MSDPSGVRGSCPPRLVGYKRQAVGPRGTGLAGEQGETIEGLLGLFGGRLVDSRLFVPSRNVRGLQSTVGPGRRQRGARRCLRGAFRIRGGHVTIHCDMETNRTLNSTTVASSRRRQIGTAACTFGVQIGAPATFNGYQNTVRSRWRFVQPVRIQTANTWSSIRMSRSAIATSGLAILCFESVSIHGSECRPVGSTRESLQQRS